MHVGDRRCDGLEGPGGQDNRPKLSQTEEGRGHQLWEFCPRSLGPPSPRNLGLPGLPHHPNWGFEVLICLPPSASRIPMDTLTPGTSKTVGKYETG